jgi:hypothetical protein
MAVASTSVFWTALSFVMTTTEVYREFRDPAMTVHRSMEASSNHILHEIAPHRICCVLGRISRQVFLSMMKSIPLELIDLFQSTSIQNTPRQQNICTIGETKLVKSSCKKCTKSCKICLTRDFHFRTLTSVSSGGTHGVRKIHPSTNDGR